ncbi:hypothetical protein PR003_g19952 [Phytophthora rubi]|uniref:Uncharacterized protein n=1 Tax=Phytophthora rubi TaxID=129364 RepID=A0A6A3K5P2_9STRA|nr:hypothetical protein PR002_g19710 [Phytophthora rubi]KAE9000878.1 hypothetical protein PR001_g18666 [Phytophthora rubi]KAE9311672.1 hypothetical protein PR003_g19952 [Phytophthora rubi]
MAVAETKGKTEDDESTPPMRLEAVPENLETTVATAGASVEASKPTTPSDLGAARGGSDKPAANEVQQQSGRPLTRAAKIRLEAEVAKPHSTASMQGRPLRRPAVSSPVAVNEERRRQRPPASHSHEEERRPHWRQEAATQTSAAVRHSSPLWT